MVQRFTFLGDMFWILALVWYLQISWAFVATPFAQDARGIGSIQEPQLRQDLVGRKRIACAARSRSNVPEKRLEEGWFPTEHIEQSEFEGTTKDSVRQKVEVQSILLMARLVSARLQKDRHSLDSTEASSSTNSSNRACAMAKGRFVDLCCTIEGEKILEALFEDEEASKEEARVVRGAVISLQSLAILGTQFGVKAALEQVQQSVSHLVKPSDEIEAANDYTAWDASSTRRLKYENIRTPGLQLLAELQRKRSAQGAYELLVKLCAWQKHEDLALLRSGFSMRFSSAEIMAAEKVSAIYQVRHYATELPTSRPSF
jgi:hypothetical protein